jgi:adenylate cyclase
MERRLSAIVAADVVGYSRLIGADEEGTIAALQALRADLIDPKLSEHNGRIVKLMGDGMLIEFPSIVDAVRAAVATQQALTEHNSSLPEDRRIEFRVGINLGDVVIDGDDIQGDGVNVAARLEGLAQPGGICISEGVYEQVRDRLDLPFQDLGEKEVKNIARPVRVWQWLPTASATPAPAAPESPLPLPDKPSVAVLPFDSMSSDAEQEFLADGLAEDITTMLSNLRWMFVIARNSAFSYKGQTVSIAQVGRELGVRYVLEGSVRKAGNRIRVNAQLIEAASGNHLWADKYDREIDDIFAIQDDITKSIVGMLETEIANAEQVASLQRPANLDAWTAYQRGMSGLAKNYVPEDLKQSLADFSTAVDLDPKFAAAYAGLSMAGLLLTGWGRLDLDEISGAKQRVLDSARQAVRLDERDPWTLAVLARAQLYNGDFDGARRSAERALSLSPNSFQALWAAAIVAGFTGDSEKALRLVDEVDRVSPRSPFRQVVGPLIKSVAHINLARADNDRSQYSMALDYSDQGISETAGIWPRLMRCAALYQLGRHEEAETEMRRINSNFPEFSAENLRQFSFVPDPDFGAWFLDVLLRVGLRD